MSKITSCPKVLRYLQQNKLVSHTLRTKITLKVGTRVPYHSFTRRRTTGTDLSTLITLNTFLSLWVGEHVILQPVLANQLFPAHLQKHPVIFFTSCNTCIKCKTWPFGDSL